MTASLTAQGFDREVLLGGLEARAVGLEVDRADRPEGPVEDERALAASEEVRARAEEHAVGSQADLDHRRQRVLVVHEPLPVPLRQPNSEPLVTWQTRVGRYQGEPRSTPCPRRR